MNWKFPRSIYITTLMCSTAEEYGLPVASCLARSGISPEQLTDPDTEVLASQELSVIHNIVRGLDHVPDIGLEIGSRFDLSVYGLLAFALSSCANFRELIDVGTRFSKLTFLLTEPYLVEQGGEARFIFRDEHLPPSVRSFVFDRDIAALHNIINKLYDVNPPWRRTEVRFPRPSYADRYRQLLAHDIEFETDQNVVYADSEVLDLPLPHANPQALKYWSKEIQRLLDRRQEVSGVAGKVRAILVRDPSKTASMEAVATEMSTTPRNLRRWLSAENTSFRTLVDELRRTLAEELLGTAGLSVNEVADRLGYQEATSFIVAFKRWKGVSPTQWIRQQPGQRVIHATQERGATTPIAGENDSDLIKMTTTKL